MRARLALLLTLVLLATSAFGKEVFLAVSGTANNVFFSDARIFNPNDKDITVEAYYYKRGNTNGTSKQPVSFTVTKRQMKIFDDIVATLLNDGDVGGIRFVSADDFVVTQRVYAISNTCNPGAALPCTLGQFVQGIDVTKAIKNGVLLQLEVSDKFRTNVGAANTSNQAANVTWKLYDKNNVLVATKSETLQPFGVLGPTSVQSYFGAPGTADLSDAWVSFTSDQAILAYGSVVDNGSTDQTYIAASEDSGVSPAAPKLITIAAQNFAFSVEAPSTLRAGDIVVVRVTGTGGPHGFQLLTPTGTSLVSLSGLSSTPQERTITLPTKGTYSFFCTNTACGEGHFDMTGTIDVGEASITDPGDRY